MKAKTMSARRANTLDKICSVRRDNFSSGKCNIHTDQQKVHIYDGKDTFMIPKKDFNRLIDWYNREQKVIR